MSHQTPTLRFQCPHCQAKLRGKAADAGGRKKCPQCQQVFVIPRPKLREENVLPAADGMSEPGNELIPVVCGVCQTRMYGTRDQIGSLMECPDCFTQNLIKEPPPSRVNKPVLNTGLGYGLAPAAELSAPKSYAQEIMQAADSEIEKRIIEEPQVPDRPMLDGVIGFALRQQAWPVVLGIALAISMVLGVVKIALIIHERGDAAGIFVPILMAFTGILSLFVAFPMLVCWLKVFENTAQGIDDAEFRPEGGLLAFVDWVADTFYLLIAATLSIAPGLFLSHRLGVSRPAFGAVMLGSSLVFPVLLLSMMESASIIGIYSRPIWGSLRSQFGNWMKFYTLGTLLLALAAGAAIGIGAIAAGPVDWARVIAVVVLLYGWSALMTTYFRLLGRLAWVLTKNVVIEEDDADDSMEKRSTRPSSPPPLRKSDDSRDELGRTPPIGRATTLMRD